MFGLAEKADMAIKDILTKEGNAGTGTSRYEKRAVLSLDHDVTGVEARRYLDQNTGSSVL